MFGGTPYNDNFYCQFMLNLEGMLDNVFCMPFNVKSKIEKTFQIQQFTHIYVNSCGLCHDDVLARSVLESLATNLTLVWKIITMFLLMFFELFLGSSYKFTAFIITLLLNAIMFLEMLR